MTCGVVRELCRLLVVDRKRPEEKKTEGATRMLDVAGDAPLNLRG